MKLFSQIEQYATPWSRPPTGLLSLFPNLFDVMVARFSLIQLNG